MTTGVGSDSGLETERSGSEDDGCVSIATSRIFSLSRDHGTLYVGVTNDLACRVAEHRSCEGSKFTTKHGVHTLVWYERHQVIETAIAREKAIRKWNRVWKIGMIERSNPHWDDLFSEMAQ